MTSPSVLVVDDEADTCRNLADIFADLGYRVDTAEDGTAALERVRRTRYDVAILDLMMPGMDGLALYQEIRQLRPETVAVLATAYPNHPRAEASLAQGVWRLVPKPVDLPRLIALLGEALAQPLVLIVDDDPDLCASLWDLFRDRGFRVGLAHDARSAADRVREAGFKVVLIDMRLPDGDGGAVLRAVRQAQPDARTVLITAHRAELEPAVQQLAVEGVDAVCYKPFDLDQLLATLGRLSRP
ncbi:MAG TPA: response regulator [Gemmataceae bacterium]|jgi:DNA-binding NtrC family response regulator